MVEVKQPSQVNASRATQVEHIRHSRDVVHAYSPSIRKLFDLALTYIDFAEEENRKGNGVIWCNGRWEAPLVYADGVIPASWGEMGRISGLEAVEVAENHFQFPPELCSMVKATIGGWYTRREHGIRRLFGTAVSCEPFNQAWELMRQEGYDVYTMDVIYRGPDAAGEAYDQLLHYFIQEIYDFQEWLTGSRAIDKEKLRVEIDRKNDILRKVRRIMELRLEHPFYMRSLPLLYMLIGISHDFGRPEAYREALGGIISELEALPPDEAEKQRAIPLVWAGGTGQEFGVYEAIDNANGALLAFVSVPYEKDYRTDIDPVEALARYLLDSQSAGATVYQRRAIERHLERVHGKGLILYGYLGCSFSSVAREMNRSYFHKKGIPSINLEGTFQIGEPTGQLLTRIKAFIEMLS